MKTILSVLFTSLIFYILPLNSKILPVKEINPNKRLICASSVKPINFLTLNTWGLPILMPNSNNKVRFEKILDNINSNKYDIICLQETFNAELRKKLYYETNQSYIHDDKWLQNRSILGTIHMDKQGGLITLSKFPIIEEQFISFKSYNNNLIEDAGRKGFLLSFLDTWSDTIIVINTHLHADENEEASKIRLLQMKEINAYLKSKRLYEAYPMYLAGDLNIHTSLSYSKCKDEAIYQFLTNEMGMIDPMHESQKNYYSYDFTMNKYASKKSRKQKLDYIFYSNNNFTKPLHNSQVIFTGDEALSDHCGIMAQIN